MRTNLIITAHEDACRLVDVENTMTVQGLIEALTEYADKNARISLESEDEIASTYGGLTIEDIREDSGCIMIEARKDTFRPSEVRETMTVQELIEALTEYAKPEMDVYISHYDGEAFGALFIDDIRQEEF